MKMISMKEVAAGMGAALVRGEGTQQIDSVVIDSRQAKEGALFVAIRGERQDGHIYAEAATRQGCRAFLLSEEETIDRLSKAYPDGDIIAVSDTTAGLQELSRWYLSQFDLIRTAVTGSTGKTSTKEMLAAILSRKYKTVKNEGNFNNELGLPLTIFNVDETTEAAVFEMGMSSFGEIHLLADIVRPHAAAITNVGTSHIEFLKTRENIQKAKMEITDFFGPEDVLVVNSDNEYLSLSAVTRYITARRQEDPDYGGRFRLVTAGEVGRQDICLSHVDDMGEKGITFTLMYRGESQDFLLPLPGRHNAYNAMVAVGVGLQFGISLGEAARALRSMTSTSRRLVIESVGDYKLIDDSYNASPDSIAAAVDVLKHVTGGRKVAVLADILELGEQSETLHRQSGRIALSGGADLLIACGPEAKYMAEAARELLMQQGETPETIDRRVMYFADHDRLSEEILSLLQPGDVVLVKGSNGMRMSVIAEQIRGAAKQKEQ